jgi:hypothetical protein
LGAHPLGADESETKEIEIYLQNNYKILAKTLFCLGGARCPLDI